jgi:hypothetical protein
VDVRGVAFEIWDSICFFDYASLTPGSVDVGPCLVISLEKLLLLKALAMEKPKYHRDLELIVAKIRRDQYAAWWEQLTEEQRAMYDAQRQGE